jgi:signal transduction histidine kinase
MLTLQRLEAEGFELAQVNLAEITNAAIEDARAAAHHVGLVIKTDIPKKLPTILGGPNQLSRVFDNLLSNAIKFSPYGGIVTVHIREESDHVNVYISDPGIGIPPDKLERLFDRFYRADVSEGKRIPGSGLGLSIVKAIVEGHGGQVSVKSQEDQGTTFSFSVPKGGPDTGPVPPPAPLSDSDQ